MCQWCAGDEEVRGDFIIVARPAQEFVGRLWEGTYSQAAAGAIHAVLNEVKAFSGGLPDLWAGPLVGISWNDRPDGFRYFVGVETNMETGVASDWMRLSLPEMRLVTSWHSNQDGDVTDHYVRMIRWLEAGGHRWDKNLLHHREEYPPHADFSQAPVLRLMLPLAAA